MTKGVVGDGSGASTASEPPESPGRHLHFPSVLYFWGGRGTLRSRIRAACTFVEQTGGTAAIGSISDIEALLHGDAGTTVAPAAVPTT